MNKPVQMALDEALAVIRRAFAPPMNLKRRVRILMKGDFWIFQYRYQEIMHRHAWCSLAEAIVWVDAYMETERRKRQVAIDLWGRYSGTNTRLFHLMDAALMLRWLRRYRPLMWPRMRDDILSYDIMDAAE